MADNAALMRRWFDEIWNKGNARVIEELLAPDGIGHGLNDAQGQDLRDIRATDADRAARRDPDAAG